MFFSRRQKEAYYNNLTDTGLLFEHTPYDIVHPFQLPSFNQELGLSEKQGFRTVCTIKDDCLLIDKIQLILPEGESYPTICGKKPVQGYNILEGFEMLWGTYDGMVYENLAFPVNITGSLLVGTDAEKNALMVPDFGSSNLYGWYQKLLLLEFSDGILTDKKDVSGMSEDEFQAVSALAEQIKKTKDR